MRVLAFDWSALIASSSLLRGLLIVLAALLCLLLGWFVSLREMQGAYRLAMVQGRDALEALAVGKARIAGLEGERLALADAQQRLQEARWRLDAGEAMSELLDQLAVSGRDHGLVFERIDVQPEQPGDGYRRVPLVIQVAGHYPGLRGWLEHWLQQVRLLDIAQVSLERTHESSGLLSVQLRV